MSTRQVEIDFEGGLLERFPAFRDVLRASVYGCRRPFKAVAADLDMRSSELSRKLADNPNDLVHFPADRLPELLEATGDLLPLYWLVEKFLEDGDSRRRRAVSELERLLPQLQSALDAVREEDGPAVKAVR